MLAKQFWSSPPRLGRSVVSELSASNSRQLTSSLLRSPIFRTLFQVSYALTPVFSTSSKNDRGYGGKNSAQGLLSIRVFAALPSRAPLRRQGVSAAAKSFICHTSARFVAKSNHCHTSKNPLPQLFCLPHLRPPPLYPERFLQGAYHDRSLLPHLALPLCERRLPRHGRGDLCVERTRSPHSKVARPNKLHPRRPYFYFESKVPILSALATSFSAVSYWLSLFSASSAPLRFVLSFRYFFTSLLHYLSFRRLPAPAHSLSISIGNLLQDLFLCPGETYA